MSRPRARGTCPPTQIARTYFGCRASPLAVRDTCRGASLSLSLSLEAVEAVEGASDASAVDALEEAKAEARVAGKKVLPPSLSLSLSLSRR